MLYTAVWQLAEFSAWKAALDKVGLPGFDLGLSLQRQGHSVWTVTQCNSVCAWCWPGCLFGSQTRSMASDVSGGLVSARDCLSPAEGVFCQGPVVWECGGRRAQVLLTGGDVCSLELGGVFLCPLGGLEPHRLASTLHCGATPSGMWAVGWFVTVMGAPRGCRVASFERSPSICRRARPLFPAGTFLDRAS